MSNQPYTYCEVDSSLYAPDGTFLKKVYCPKAVDWNQLIADDPEDRSRGCIACLDRILNLDVADVGEVVQTLKQHGGHCVFGTEKSIRFLKDPNRPASACLQKEADPVVIQTVRGQLDINRGAASGYWPDVRLVTYDTKALGTKCQVMQDSESGKVVLWGDYREKKEGHWQMKEGSWSVAIPWTTYYPYYQESPFAAYLVPKGLAAGSSVIVADPIEDIQGLVWNQGDADRAKNVKGVWDGERIVLDMSSVECRFVVG